VWRRQESSISNCERRQEWSIWSWGRRKSNERTGKCLATLIQLLCNSLTSSQRSRIKIGAVSGKSLKKLTKIENVQINSHVHYKTLHSETYLEIQKLEALSLFRPSGRKATKKQNLIFIFLDRKQKIFKWMVASAPLFDRYGCTFDLLLLFPVIWT
jgi:hypothetical protein